MISLVMPAAARTRRLMSTGSRSSATCASSAMNSPYGARSPKMPGEPMRVQLSRARANKIAD
jgi:hypothetical protein